VTAIDTAARVSRRSWGSGALRGSWLMIACYAVFATVIVCAVAGEVIVARPPDAQDLLLGVTPPGEAGVLGTDDLGRDVLSRTIVGARTALIGPAVVAIGAMVLGTVLGLVAGFRGGRSDSLIMRVVDLVASVPALLAAIVSVGILGGGYWIGIALLVVLGIPGDTRIVRAGTLAQRNLPYVEAATTLGLPRWRVMVRHIWPNIWPVVVANTFLSFSFALVNISALSFLGIGVEPGTPDWGLMLAESRRLISENPMAAVAPALALAVTSMSANLIGDDLFERLSNRGRAR
jgi:peptide/nickel transport system permease protein